MNRKNLLLAALLLPVALVAGAADRPDVFLRGDMTGGWDARPEFKFTCTGDVYTLHLAELDGRFKIADKDWAQFDMGAAAKGITVATGLTYELAPKGENFNSSHLRDVTLSFTMTDGAPMVLKVEGTPAPVAGISGTLPVLYINVYTDADHTALNDEIISKDLDHKNYFEYADYYLDLNGCDWLAQAGAESIGTADEPLPLKIKARGNWTRRGFAKKPFKLKLDAKQSMLGLTKSKHFALLAHADDNMGYLRNFTGFNLGRRIGLPWTPAQQPVEVVINGDYRGLYFLTESIRVEKGRVEITELDDLATDPAAVSGGYLVELDNYDEENQIRLEEKSYVGGQKLDVLRITADTPEVYSELQRRFVTDRFTAMNNAVGANDDVLWSYLDLDDAARYYIVEEIISHTESYHGSTYLFCDNGSGQKWHFSPLWDCGNAFNGPTDGFFYDHDSYGNTWIPSMRENARFNAKVADTWLWFMSGRYEGIESDIDEYAARISAAAVADRRRWRDAPVPDGGTAVADNSDMAARAADVKSRLRAKTAWLKGIFGDYSVGTHPEPERDTTPAAPLPSYAQSGVEDVVIAPGRPEAPAACYDIYGRAVRPDAPGLKIMVGSDGSARKIIR